MYAVVDVETTGGAARYERIIEIAVVLHDGERVVDTFDTLIYPERSIPWHITQITGISDEMVANAPRFFEVAKQIVEMTRDAVFVAHNASFDYGFLREEFARLGYTYTCRQRLCTVRLTRKVFPGLASYSLDNLRKHFGIASERAHRALDDALAAARLLELALSTQGGTAQAQALLRNEIQASRLPEGVSLERLQDVPEACGVYYLHDAYGRVVYVGKSINMCKRLMEHFADTSPKGEKLRATVADFSFEMTGSELVALLLESAEIKRLQPSINRALRQRTFQAAIYTYTDEFGYRRLAVGRRRARHRLPLEIVAELPRLSQARSRLESIARRFDLCLKLCHLEEGSHACFHYHLSRCQGACIGLEAPDVYNGRAEQAIAALSRQLSGSFAIVEDGRTPAERAVVFVVEGAFAGYAYVDTDTDAQLLHALEDARIPFSDPDAQRIIQSYLENRQERIRLVPL